MTNEELSNGDLLKLFRQASQELIGGGGRARSWYFELEEEVLSRMEKEEKVNVQSYKTHRG